jgi:hypothetical protein
MPVPNTFANLTPFDASLLNANFAFLDEGVTGYTLLSTITLGSDLSLGADWDNSSAFSFSDAGDYVVVIKVISTGDTNTDNSAVRNISLTGNSGSSDINYGNIHRLNRNPPNAGQHHNIKIYFLRGFPAAKYCC